MTALIVNENLLQWALAVRVGGYTVAAGLEDAFAHLGYLSSTAFRFIPHVGLGTYLVTVSKTKMNDYVPPMLPGGMIGILAMIPGARGRLRPDYTDEHMSSTTATAFLPLPIYAKPTGAVGAVLLALRPNHFRSPFKIEETERPPAGDVLKATHEESRYTP